MTGAAVDRMAGHLTLPFARGADRMPLAFAAAGATAQHTSVDPYDFAEHIARFDADPAPRYVLTTLTDIDAQTTVTVTYEVTPPSGVKRTGVAKASIAARTPAGASVGVQLGPDEGPDTRLTALDVEPAPARGTGSAATDWAMTALLANLAKLLWMAGAERDIVAAHQDRLRTATRRRNASGSTLDLLGYDLGVPRFPPLPYGFEAHTVALFHCDDTTGTQLTDANALYGGSAHPATLVDANLRAVGRFGLGCAFRARTAQATVPDHPDFAAGALDSLTVECFLKPDAGPWTGAALSKSEGPTDPTKPGWAIAVGDFGRGFDKDVGATLSDGTTTVQLFADVVLDTSGFHHVALVLDRTEQQARLHVDGTMRASQTISGLGALTSTAALLIGRAGASPSVVFAGVIDEIRVSRVARDGSFHPVLGEEDDSYRRRLRIFQRWSLPTPDNIQQALNEVAGTVADITGTIDVADPFVVDDTNGVLAGATHPVVVLPATIPPGTSIDDLGSRHSFEVDVCGTPADDDGYEPTLLVDATDPRADFALPSVQMVPGQPPADPRHMRVGARRILLALLDLLDAESIPGRVLVVGAFDPATSSMRSVGRAIILSHSHLRADVLALYAHRAGFSWVSHRDGQDDVYAAVRSTETIEVAFDPSDPATTATPGDGFDLLETQALAIRVNPLPPNGIRCAWSVITCGAGRAELASNVDSPHAVLTAAHSGELTVDVQINKGARAFSATRQLRVGVSTLAVGESIAADGSRGVDESAAGSIDDEFFDPAYLLTSVDPRISYPPGVDDRRMQPVTSTTLTTLLDLLAAHGVAGAPAVTAGWRPGGAGLETVGRALTIEPGVANITADRLAALAHAAEFGYVHNTGSAVRLGVSPGDPLTIIGANVVTEGEGIALAVTTRALPAAGVAAGSKLCVANSGTDTVSFIDRTDGAIPQVTKVGIDPTGIAAAPDGLTVFTADSGGTVTAISVTTGLITGSAPISGKPVAIVHNPINTDLYAAIQGVDQIAVIDGAGPTVTGTHQVGAQPVAVAIDPTGTTLWIALGAGAAAQAMDTATAALAAPIALPGPATGIAVTPTHAYVTVATPPRLVVIDTASRQIINVFADLGPEPAAVTTTPDGNTVCVADSSEGAIYLRRPDGSVATPASVRTGRTPVGLVAIDEFLYVLNRAVQGGADNVGVLNLNHPRALATVWPLGTGHGERLSWTVRTAADAAGRVSSSTAPDVDLLGQQSGPLLVEAFYAWQDHPAPYTLRIQLNAALVAAERGGKTPVIRKDQYDLVMNVLNDLHPIGVAVDTSVIRAHVLELRAGLSDVDPGYTYPSFRLGQLKPPARRSPDPT